jgi:type VI secretion system secreted protein VgrG
VAERRLIRLQLRVGPLADADVEVTRASGVEALSTPYAFDVEFYLAASQPLAPADLVGTEARLELKRPNGPPRHVHGLCLRAEAIGPAESPHYRIRIGPRLALLGQVAGSRIYQPNRGSGGRGGDALEIVRGLLDAWNVPYRDDTRASPVRRDVTVQYRETDLDFVSRMLADEGVCFWFEHSDDRHVMVLADAPTAFAALPPPAALPWRPEGSAAAPPERLLALRRCRAAVPATAVLRDYDFEKPRLDLTARAGSGPGPEVYDHPGGHTDPATGKRLAQLRLEEARRAAETFRGEGTCARLAPGLGFEVEDHPSISGRLVATRVEHEAVQQTRAAEQIEEGYRNRFEALPDGAPFRPPRRVKPYVPGVQTAMVVGAAGEEIHTDAHGRIKVEFHWDRDGLHADGASAWIRVGQRWAGPGWGALFLPRVGQEVVVRFEEGDPDRPLVTGAVYDGRNPTPVELPKDKTVSTLRTSTSPGGSGANELLFEDAQGAERVAVHAQRDETIQVLHDKTQRVKATETLKVAKDRTRTVDGNQQLRVALADDTRVDGRQSLVVQGDRRVSVAGSHRERVGVQQATTVGGARSVVVGTASSEAVGAAAVLTVGGAYAISAGGAINYAVGGAATRQIGGAHVEVVGAARSEVVGGDAASDVGGDFAADVDGRVSSSVGQDENVDVSGKAGAEVKQAASISGKKITLEADELTVSVGGDVALKIDKSGNVTLLGKKILIDGSSGIELKASKIAKDGPGGAEQAAVSVPSLKPLPGEKAFVDLTVKDAAGKPVAYQLFTVEFPDGKVKTGYTDQDGKAHVPGAKEGTCKVSFPGLDGKSWRPS